MSSSVHPVAWAIRRTKDDFALDAKFLGKKGQFNLNQVEKFGAAPEIKHGRDDGDVLHLRFQRQEHLHPTELKKLLAEHLKGFREMMG